MDNHHTAAGILALAVTIVFLAIQYFHRSRRRALPLRAWIGLWVILCAEILLALHWSGLFSWDGFAIFLTPIVWTGFLLLIDALVWTLDGSSLMSPSPRKFWGLAAWSLPLWLIFEAYNLRLVNWTYVGLPSNPWVSGLGYAWSFATIWPAIFECADFVRALGIFQVGRRFHYVLSSSSRFSIGLCGLLMVSVPLLVPKELGQYTFGAVWVGFIFLLDPLIYRWKGQTFLREMEHGDSSVLRSFLLGGAVCGILWEFWNYWAAAKWLYIFPIGQGSKVFEMPLLGYLGFPAFALECRVMYEFLRSLKDQLLKLRADHELETAKS
jgi:hypothetical protein